MKKIFLTFIIISSIILVFSGRTINLAAVSQPPYYGPDLKNNGYVSEIIVEAFKASGYKDVKINFWTWARDVAEVKQGKADGLYGLWYQKEREDWVYYSEPLPYAVEELCFIKLKTSKIKETEPKDLKNYTIGIVNNYAYDKKLFTYGLTLKSNRSDEVNIDRLISGKLDIILMNHVIFQDVIKKKYPEYNTRWEIIGKPFQMEKNYLGISKQIPDGLKLLKDFNDGLKKIASNGTLKKILENKEK